ncbi:hypothetical protein DTO195F2_3831 [Paecilomyces variotii]|nr:hypothetical protein DTO195F2_3831 [Paecilomyces variotii]KAJ9323138.1 hypothetical protein DTO027B3_5932 [Paecilomyces variotii]KAJ9394863.1 hypothetical protein DTO282F9_8249 [Paecilomyces variotii]
MCVPGLWFLIRNRHALLRTWNPQYAYQREDEEHNDYDAPRSHFRDIENRNIVPRIRPAIGGLAEQRQRILLSLELQFQSLTTDSSQFPHTHNVSSRRTPPEMIENSSSVCVSA